MFFKQYEKSVQRKTATFTYWILPLIIVFFILRRSVKLEPNQISSKTLAVNESQIICIERIKSAQWLGKTSKPIICHHIEDKTVSKTLRRGGLAESRLHSFLFSAVFPKFPGAAFFDIGANFGLYTASAASLNIQVFAFEPVPITYFVLLSTVSKNNLTAKVTALNIALSNQSGCGNWELQLGIHNLGAVQIDKLSNCQQYSNKVPIKTLDELIPFVKKQGVREVVMKLDVQEMEILILKGGRLFFETFKVQYFVFEWTFFRKAIIEERNTKYNTYSEIVEFIHYVKNSYKIVNPIDGSVLHSENASNWPQNVGFIRV